MSSSKHLFSYVLYRMRPRHPPPRRDRPTRVRQVGAREPYRVPGWLQALTKDGTDEGVSAVLSVKLKLTLTDSLLQKSLRDAVVEPFLAPITNVLLCHSAPRSSCVSR